MPRHAPTRWPDRSASTSAAASSRARPPLVHGRAGRLGRGAAGVPRARRPRSVASPAGQDPRPARLRDHRQRHRPAHPLGRPSRNRLTVSFPGRMSRVRIPSPAPPCPLEPSGRFHVLGPDAAGSVTFARLLRRGAARTSARRTSGQGVEHPQVGSATAPHEAGGIAVDGCERLVRPARRRDGVGAARGEPAPR